MAVTFDAVGPAGGGGAHSGTGDQSWTHVVAADATMLVVGLAGPDPGACTAGGTTMTTNAASNLWRRSTNDQTTGYAQLYVLPSPPTGTITIASSGGNQAAGGSMSFKGTPTDTTAYGTPVSAVGSGTVESVTVTGTAASSVVAAVSASGSSEAGTAVSPAVKRWSSTADGGGAANNSGGLTSAGGGDITVQHNITSDWWAILAVEVKAAAEGSESGPVYAGTAADLGGGSGSWADAANAQGGDNATYATWAVP